MEKLELKHVIDLAKHRGRLRCLDDDNIFFDDEIKIIDFTNGYIETKEGLMIELSDFGEKVFMVKKTLSDLTREELISAGFDSHIDYLTHEHQANPEKFQVKKAPYEMVQYLILKHYDTEGLIEKGLAIDVNIL